jgi:hypothetical protein
MSGSAGGEAGSGPGRGLTPAKHTLEAVEVIPPATPAGLSEAVLPAVDDTDAFIAAQAAAIRSAIGRFALNVIEIGNCLIAVKARLQHGAWLPWLEREFGWSDRAARNYMRAAVAFKPETVSNLAILEIQLIANKG